MRWLRPLYMHSFSVYEHPTTILENLELETSPHLICLLETNVMLFHAGELTRLSYIICGSLPVLDWLNQHSCIEASIDSAEVWALSLHGLFIR